jgi:hypothetical protein
MKIRIGKYRADTFPIQNGLNERDAMKTLFFSFALEYENHLELKLNKTCQLLVYAAEVYLLVNNINTIRRKKGANRS